MLPCFNNKTEKTMKEEQEIIKFITELFDVCGIAYSETMDGLPFVTLDAGDGAYCCVDIYPDEVVDMTVLPDKLILVQREPSGRQYELEFPRG